MARRAWRAQEARGGAVLVVPMRVDDAARISRLFEDIVHELPYYNPRAKEAALSKYDAAGLLGQIEHDPQSVLVATVDGDIAGFCFSQQDDGLIWLAWFGVAKHFRRNGVALSILDAMDGRARTANIHKIWCDCRTTNQASQVVLQRASFRPICTFNRHWHDQDYIIWERFVS